MIVAIGLDVDDTFARFVEQAVNAEAPLKFVNLRAVVDHPWRIDLPPRGPAVVHQGDADVELNPDDSYYCRLIDLSVQNGTPGGLPRWQGLLNALRGWLEDVPGRVVNRLLGGAHNGSKPLHEAVLRDLGFRIPESLTTCDVDELRQFVREGPTISKTVCGIRADTVLVTEADFENFDPASGPVHVQRFVPGADARIHVVGDSLVAQRVAAGAVDYRRAAGLNEMEVFECPAELRALLIQGTQHIGLAFAGWDFKISDDGVYWCLEANPMPGYSPYDRRCDGAISRNLLQYLGAEAPPRCT